MFTTSCLLTGWLALSCFLAQGQSAAPPPPASPSRQLIRDPHFQAGFTVLEPKPGQRVPYGILPGNRPDSAAIWDLAQWSSRHPLPLTPPVRLPGGTLLYTNAGKAVLLGGPGSTNADLSLTVTASQEYITHARRPAEPWVHLLAQQNIENPPSLAELSTAHFHIEARLSWSHKMDTPDYSPSRHAAQFQVFLTVQNRNRQSPGYGHYLWFGIPIYDDRYRIPKGHKAPDTAGSKMFIFTPDGEVFTTQTAHDRDWITLDQDLLPLIREGLQTAWQRGFLRDSRILSDYCLTGLNLGWEVPGTFDVAMQVRNLSLLVEGTGVP